jgi:single-stranded-DNA-specific exonuclease
VNSVAKQWRSAEVDIKVVRRISKALDLPPAIAKILVARGITKPKEIRAWLSPSLEDLHSPERLTGLKAAVKIVLRVLEAGEKICVFGDFDVDGLTSTALLTSVLRDLGAQVVPVIPDRFSQGYGLHGDTIRRLAAAGVKLLISADCGISNIEETALAKQLGLEVIVVDHHEPSPELPEADAIINPRQPGCPYPFKDLAAVGLVFKLAQALTAAAGRPDSALDHLDLVALGTVADMAPLVGENRILVHQGLAAFNPDARPGLAKLRQVSGLGQGGLSAGEISFGLAPRLNACGRLASGRTALDLLLTRDPSEALKLATQLDRDNAERRKIEQKMFEEAIEMVETTPDAGTIVLGSENWHEGVKGIVASRLVERLFRPTILFSIRDGLAIGSGRSIPGLDLYKALEGCAELLVTWGGHRAAAGVTVRAQDLDKFRSVFERVAAQALGESDMVDYLTVDLELDPEEIEPRLVDELARLGPFGRGNPVPVLALRRVFTEGRQPLGRTGEHLKFLIQKNRFIGEGVAFRVDPQSSLLKTGRPLDVAFQLNNRLFNGRSSLQLKVIDAKESPGSPEPRDKKANIRVPTPGSGFMLPPAGPATSSFDQINFIDRRSIEDNDAHLLELLSSDVPTAVYVRDEHEGVQLANRLAKLNGDLRADVTITCGGPGDDVEASNRLVIYQAPFTTAAMVKLCSRPESGPLLVYLLYGTSDLKRAEATIASLCPDRARLAVIYRLLRAQAPFDLDEAAALCRKELAHDVYPPAIRELTARALKIFTEIDLVASSENDKMIIKVKSGKADLEGSSSWKAAQSLRSEFRRFADIALTAPPQRLLKLPPQ